MDLSKPPHGNTEMYKQLVKLKKGPRGRFFPDPPPPIKSTENQKVKINFCVPLWNRARHITELLENIQTIAAEKKETNFKVWIADFKSTDIDLRQHVKKYQFPVEIVLIDPPFIIAKGLQIATEKMPMDEIVYFVDADAHLPDAIFNRLRVYVIKGKQFYCPMVSYEQQNGKLVLPPKGKDHGGKGHIGVFTNDFRLCNGWRDNEHYTEIPIAGPGPMDRQKWGGHDGHLYNKLRWDQLNVYRPRESDQYVKFHTRESGWYVKNRTNRIHKQKK